ncbi:MAG: thioredoxin family protein [Chloroflexota bacterium]|nr:thioredoxin family protein [Chloroflexota bacterium]
MIERAALALVIIAVASAAWMLYQRAAVRRLSQTAPVDPLFAHIPRGTPVVLYFTTPFCAPCKMIQQPALERLKGQMGDGIAIVQIDATQDTTAADRWGVIGAPTTFVLDAEHRVRHINRGVALTDQLARQLAA